MAISRLQLSTRGTSSGPTLPVVASFSSTPAVGSWAVLLLSSGAGKFGSDPTGWSVTDNQAPPNTYTQRGVATADGNRLSVWTAPIETASGTFTVTATVAPGTVDSSQGLSLIEYSPLDGANLVDVLVQLSDEISYLTAFNVSSPAPTDFADEVVLAFAVPRGNGSFNAAPSPSVPPSGFSTLFKVDSGDGAGYAAERITTVTGTQSVNLTGLPIDGGPGLIFISFRGAATPPSGPTISPMPYPRRVFFPV